MKCIVTAGPTYEPLDEARRLTNFSTGRLGSELVNFLVEHGHEVTLLIGQQSTWRGERRARHVETFSTTADLRARLKRLASTEVGAVFHAAAVSDFAFGKIWQRNDRGELSEIKAGKISSRQNTLLAELVPTLKVIAGLRSFFPQACIIGWKYEVDGTRQDVLTKAEVQITENRANGCVANGPAYGPGFGLVTGPGKCLDCAGITELFSALENLVQNTKL